MISMGIAVRIRIGPLPYAVAAASAASDSPTVAAGADEAMPMTVSWATPIALGSGRGGGWGGIPTIAVAGRSVIRLPFVLARRAPDAPRRCEGFPAHCPATRAIITIISGIGRYVPDSNLQNFPQGSQFPKATIPPQRYRWGQSRESVKLMRLSVTRRKAPLLRRRSRP